MKTPLPALATLLTALVLTTMLSGCSNDPVTGFTQLEVDFAGSRAAGDQVVRVAVPFNADDRPTEPIYASHDAKHPDFYSAFDQLADGLGSAALQYEVNFDPRYGPFLSSIGGKPNATEEAFWEMSVNGQVATAGMGDVELSKDDKVTWHLTVFQAVPRFDTTSLVQAAAPAPGQEALRSLSGTLAPGVTLSARLVDGQRIRILEPVVEGTTWSLDVQAPYGQSEVQVTADDGETTQRLVIPLVRLAEATLEVKYTAAVPPHAATSDVVAYDPDAFASASMYEGKDAAHPGIANVHDLMVTWTAQTGTPIVYDYFDGLGFSPSSFDGIGQPVSASAPPYWCFKVNGQSSSFGITLQPVAPGDVVTWEYGACA
jgi:hypothetical protein